MVLPGLDREQLEQFSCEKTRTGHIEALSIKSIKVVNTGPLVTIHRVRYCGDCPVWVPVKVLRMGGSIQYVTPDPFFEEETRQPNICKMYDGISSVRTCDQAHSPSW